VRWADGAASIGIGLLLVTVALVLADETRSLIAGEAVAAPILENLRGVIAHEPRITRVRELATLHLGPRVIMVALTAEFAAMDVSALAACVDDIAAALKVEEDRVAYVYVRPARS
jgi:divalent metal cation (Fe/Co/Zn/Cd) transporter